jgi:hypothetical protein
MGGNARLCLLRLGIKCNQHEKGQACVLFIFFAVLLLTITNCQTGGSDAPEEKSKQPQAEHPQAPTNEEPKPEIDDESKLEDTKKSEPEDEEPGPADIVLKGDIDNWVFTINKKIKSYKITDKVKTKDGVSYLQETSTSNSHGTTITVKSQGYDSCSVEVHFKNSSTIFRVKRGGHLPTPKT